MKILKKYKIMIKHSLLRKLREEKRINKYLKDKIVNLEIASDVEKRYIDELSDKERKIRELKLRLKKYE